MMPRSFGKEKQDKRKKREEKNPSTPPPTGSNVPHKAISFPLEPFSCARMCIGLPVSLLKCPLPPSKWVLSPTSGCAARQLSLAYQSFLACICHNRFTRVSQSFTHTESTTQRGEIKMIDGKSGGRGQGAGAGATQDEQLTRHNFQPHVVFHLACSPTKPHSSARRQSDPIRPDQSRLLPSIHATDQSRSRPHAPCLRTSS